MCCGAKKKPEKKSVIVQPLQRPALPSNIPKSTVMFASQDYDAKPFTNQSNFVQTKKVQVFASDINNRSENYSEQPVAAKESKLISNIKLLNYDLDHAEGVSKTPIINTFHYESALNHLFVDTSKQPVVNRGTRQVKSNNYENIAPPQQYMNRTSQKSRLSHQSTRMAII